MSTNKKETNKKEEEINLHNLSESLNRTNSPKKEISVKAKQSFSCQLCNEIFSNKIELVQHETNHVDKYFTIETNSGNKSDGNLSVELSINEYNDKKSLCTETIEDLNNHILVNDTFYKQEMKGLQYKKKDNAINKIFAFDCDKELTDFSNKRTHEMTHTSKKPFACSFCEKKFSRQSAVNIHERIHTGEKPFACSFCDKKFSEKSKMKRHEMNHTGEKPFKCSFCDKIFSEKSNMKKHVRTHTS